MGEIAYNDLIKPPVVTDTVTITTQPQDVDCYVGGTATLSVVAESDDPDATLYYLWQVYNSTSEDWDDIVGASSSTYTAPTSTVGVNTYRVQIASSLSGTATSDSATVTVSADTVSIITNPGDTQVYINEGASVACEASSNAQGAVLSYQWQIYNLFDEAWIDVSGATSATYSGVDTSIVGTQQFRCVVTSSYGGTATTTSATVTVTQRDTITITTQPTTTSGCVGDTITLSVTAVSDNPNATLSYQWQVKDGATYDDISGATSSTYTVSTTTVGTERYRVIVSSDKGATDVASNYADVVVALIPTGLDKSVIVAYNGTNYMTNTVKTTGAFTETTDISNASEWYFIPTTNGYYLATYVDNTLNYVGMFSSSDNTKLALYSDISDAEEFVPTIATTNKYYLEHYNTGYYLQHSGSKSGMALVLGHTNSANSQLTITLVDGLTIVTQPQSTTILYGNSGTISVRAYGATTYQWQYYYADTWYDISGETSSTIIMSTDTDYYYIVRCVVSDGTTTIASDSANITIKDNLNVDIDTAMTTAPTYSSGYKLPAVASSYYYAVSASVIPSKAISYQWTWEDRGGYVSVVQLSGQNTDRVQLTLTATDAPNNALAGYLICSVTTEDQGGIVGSTVTKSFALYATT